MISVRHWSPSSMQKVRGSWGSLSDQRADTLKGGEQQLVETTY
jgi:hypothetical protein